MPRQELVAAVKAVANGDAVLSPQVTRQLLDRVAHRLPAATPTDGGAATLTEREREVLQLIAGGLSNAEIAAALVVAEPTAKRHVSNLLGKLGLRDRVQAVIYAYENGLIGRPAVSRAAQVRLRRGGAQRERERLGVGARAQRVGRAMCCLNVIVTGSLETGAGPGRLRERRPASGDGSENVPFDQVRRAPDRRPSAPRHPRSR